LKKGWACSEGSQGRSGEAAEVYVPKTPEYEVVDLIKA
jgi:hypothetical protein